MPAVVDTVMQRGEFLTAYTPYQPEMSQGVLQAIFEYQTAICELTGMDVSNASGYDGTTVTADACYIAKHATGRTKIVVTEATNPQVRQVVKTYAPGFGLEIVEVPHRDGDDRSRTSCARAAEGAAAVIFQQPNVFGCLEPAPELAAAANDAEALSIAHVDPLSLGVLEAPGRYGCAIALGEGQAAGNFPAYGGPHYGFLACAPGLHPADAGTDRRRDGRRRGQARLCPHPADARAAHPPREGDVEHHDEPDAPGARRARLPHVARPAGAARAGGDLSLALGLREAAAAGARRARAACFQIRQHSRSLPCASDGTRATSSRPRASAASIPGYALGRDYEGMDDVLLVAVTEKRTPAEIDRLAEVLAEVTRDEAHLREVAGRAAARRRSRATTACPRAEVPEELRRAEPPRLPEVPELELVRHFTELSQRNFGIDTGFYPLGSCTMKYNPRVNERLVALPGFANLHPLQEEDGVQGALELEWRLQEILAEVTGLHAVSLQPAAGSQGELTGLMLVRAYFEDRGESRAAPQGRDPRHGARHEPGVA